MPKKIKSKKKTVVKKVAKKVVKRTIKKKPLKSKKKTKNVTKIKKVVVKPLQTKTSRKTVVKKPLPSTIETPLTFDGFNFSDGSFIIWRINHVPLIYTNKEKHDSKSIVPFSEKYRNAIYSSKDIKLHLRVKIWSEIIILKSPVTAGDILDVMQKFYNKEITPTMKETFMDIKKKWKEEDWLRILKTVKDKKLTIGSFKTHGISFEGLHEGIYGMYPYFGSA